LAETALDFVAGPDNTTLNLNIDLGTYYIDALPFLALCFRSCFNYFRNCFSPCYR